MPSPNAITASIVINFNNSGSGGILAAEIDTRPDGYNGGKSNFTPGDQPVFLIFKTDDVTLDSVTPSAGSIGSLPDGTLLVEEYLNFAKVATAKLSKPITGALTYKWLGNNLGVPVVNGVEVTVPTIGVGVLKISYQAPFLARRLSGLGTTLSGESTYQVLILIEGHN